MKNHQGGMGLVVMLAMVLTSGVLAHPADELPEITREVRKDKKGKDVVYMFIDGVKVHETDASKQPLPVVVTPGTCATQKQPGTAPSDAVVLFDGSAESMGNWTGMKGEPSKWKLVDGALESVKKAGYIRSKEEFGSCQLHLEWSAPAKVKGDGQGRGNSGVFLMGLYEVQVLDSYDNPTYADGQASAIYGRSKPLVNASRKPGEWQSYDIIFHRPVFDQNGELTRHATFTVLHNGVLVQDHRVLTGSTNWNGPHAVKEYKAHGDEGPISLQDHGNPVRFRNVWVRKLED